MSPKAETGCDLRAECGFYCAIVGGKSEIWSAMLAKYCDGTDFPLCARRIYFLKKGLCAPLDMTPVGVLPSEILADL